MLNRVTRWRRKEKDVEQAQLAGSEVVGTTVSRIRRGADQDVPLLEWSIILISHTGYKSEGSIIALSLYMGLRRDLRYRFPIKATQWTM